MAQKYSQRGYQDGDRDDTRRGTPARSADGPKSPKMVGFHELMRCAMCGNTVELALGAVDRLSSCSKCRADLHTCRNCVSFDPGARFECRAGVTVRVASKTARNDCDAFSARRTVEKRTVESKPASGAPNDARAAFDALFKK
jgi:hypothetical protein